MNKLGIILLNWNGHEDTIECIDSIIKNEEINYTIFLLDNGSEKSSIQYIETYLINKHNISYIKMQVDEFKYCKDYTKYQLYLVQGNENLGFAKGNNLIWENIKEIYDYVILLNNDTIVTKNAISNMVEYMDKHSNVGVLSCDIRLYDNPKCLWNAGGVFKWYGERKYISQYKIDHYKKNNIESIKTPFVTGCAMMIRKDISCKYGLLTEKFFFGEEDFNYCKRLSKQNVVIETLLTSIIYHKVSKSIKKSHKSLSSYVLHFSNRIIDYRSFYHPVLYNIWSMLYKIGVLIKVLRITQNVKDSYRVVKYINYYTTKYNEISYQTFIEIKNLDFNNESKKKRK